MTMVELAVDAAVARTWTHWERYVNDGSPNRRSFIEGPSSSWGPRHGPSSVWLPCLELGGVRGHLYGRYGIRDQGGQQVLPIHPASAGYLREEALREYAEGAGFIEAVPQSSGRSFFVPSCPGLPPRSTVKLSHPGVLGRFSAGLDSGKIEFSLLLDDILARSSSASVEIAWFREVGAATADVYRDAATNGLAGCLVRAASITTTGAAGTLISLVPAFSLWGRDLFDGTRGRPLLELLSALKLGTVRRADTEDLWRRVIEPLLSSVFAVALELGLLPEPHAQNVLLAVVESNGYRRPVVVWRDLLGFHLDATWLAKHGRDSQQCAAPAHRRVITEERQASRLRSAAFDQTLYEYLLEPLLRACRQLGADDLALMERCRGFVAEKTACHPDYFPREGWYERSLEIPSPGQRLGLELRAGSSMLRRINS